MRLPSLQRHSSVPAPFDTSFLMQHLVIYWHFGNVIRLVDWLKQVHPKLPFLKRLTGTVFSLASLFPAITRVQLPYYSACLHMVNRHAGLVR